LASPHKLERRDPGVVGLGTDASIRDQNGLVIRASQDPELPAGRYFDFQRTARDHGINGYGYQPTKEEVNVMARALYSEFGREGNWEDMIAGGWSMMNRVRPSGRWPRYRTHDTIGSTLREVLEKRSRSGAMQYSFMPRGGIAAPGGSDQWQESARPETLTGMNRKAWELAVSAANSLLSGEVPDPSGGATYFHHRTAGEPRTIGGFFGEAQGRGGRRTITLTPYQSPHGENFFYRHLEDRERPVPRKLRRRPG
jgi:hypothetical protein